MIKVLITDDHRLVRAGYRRLLEDEPDIEVVGEAGSGQEALDFVRTQDVDVILLDVSMPGENGLEVLPKLKRAAPNACVLMVTMHTEKHIKARAMAAGASGYLLKESAAEELITAI
jgi:two-component system invasion response regulator UvrY